MCGGRGEGGNRRQRDGSGEGDEGLRLLLEIFACITSCAGGRRERREGGLPPVRESEREVELGGGGDNGREEEEEEGIKEGGREYQ